jgi:hypothetical protein
MLRLPQSVQEVLACGRPGVSAVGPLEKIAKASEEAAARVAQIAAEDEESERLLRGNPERLLARLEQVLVAERGTVMVDGGAEVPRPPAEGELVVIDIGSYAGVDVRGLAVSDERRAALVKRIEALYGGPEFGRQPSEVDLDDSDIDALRALGVLLEYEDEDKLYYAAARYCFDSAAILDRIEGVLSEAEKNAAAQREADAREAGEQAGAGGGEPGDADSAEALAEKAKERRAKELAEEREAKAQARRLNLDLGVRLIKRRSRKRTDKRRRELVRALALMTVAAERYLGGLGPRLTYEAWREVERKRLKSGKLGAEKVTYLEPEEARERLRKDILAAKSIDDVLDVIGDALVGAVYCSEEELPKSRRVCGYAGRLSHASHGPVRKAIDEEAKGVLPPELVEELKRSRERGYEDLAFVG